MEEINKTFFHTSFTSIDEMPIFTIIKKLLLKKFILFGFFKLLSSVCIYVSFILLDILTQNLKDYLNGTLEESTIILLLCLGIIANILLNAFMSTHCNWRKERLRLHVMTIFRIFIYSKIMHSSHSSQKKGDIDVNNLFTNDVEQASNFVFGFHYTLVSTLEIIFCIFFLYLKISSSVFYILVVLAGLFVLNLVFSSSYTYIYGKIVKKKDTRISLTKNIIQGIKSIKFLSWEEIFKEKLNWTRKEEFVFLVFMKITSMVQEFVWSSFTSLIVFVCLLGYTSSDNDIADTNIFTVKLIIMI